MHLDGLDLPPGKSTHPKLWLSTDPVPFALWARLRAVQPDTGLWPLLIAEDPHLDNDPWAEELRPGDPTDPARHDPAGLLAAWWHDHTRVDEDDMLSPDARRDVTAPFGAGWPGLAAAPPVGRDPEAHAAGYAARLLVEEPWRLALVPAGSGPEALVVAGWTGPANYTDTGEIAAVLRDWERRFGIRVLGAGAATLYVSVAEPPRDRAAALRVAAEHFAFCPDNVWQSASPYTLAAYADRLVDADGWRFWWD
ncbi:hypothetical protein Val02_01640 [Virgisporangium aliadipatigenens]|uniref:DUF4253 domain-containing protein n=1 Tax=Virgisporangium aliadipatigenens TaxID=741659 RepID=A0A8J3YFF9_9ACTN|nr:DUF4253 domain-containing protein [Virgisporangium aliadipatigenens]GIJ43278.1 hypothetical protein Val02_01640 [Virgisporangium aliadipatigenens]